MVGRSGYCSSMAALERVLDALATVHGEPQPPRDRTILELVLLENVAYLVDDVRREEAFRDLQTRVGTRPEQILAAPDEALLAVTGHGILAEPQAGKLRRAASLAVGDDLDRLRQLPLRQAKRVLERFPGIGEPGAERVLLFARAHPVLGLDSNGIRVLCRLGLLAEGSSYSATYRAAQAAMAQYSTCGFEWLIRAHQLLRRHGHNCAGAPSRQ